MLALVGKAISDSLVASRSSISMLGNLPRVVNLFHLILFYIGMCDVMSLSLVSFLPKLIRSIQQAAYGLTFLDITNHKRIFLWLEDVRYEEKNNG